MNLENKENKLITFLILLFAGVIAMWAALLTYLIFV